MTTQRGLVIPMKRSSSRRVTGVRAHHWPFGNMPQPQVTQAPVSAIVQYVRELQQANGITYRPHRM